MRSSLMIVMFLPFHGDVFEEAEACPPAEEQAQLFRFRFGSRVAMDAAAALSDVVNDTVALLRLSQRAVEGILLRLAGDVDRVAHLPIQDVCTLRAKIHRRDNFQPIVL
jgi:hypothetical protein